MPENESGLGEMRVCLHWALLPRISVSRSLSLTKKLSILSTLVELIDAFNSLVLRFSLSVTTHRDGRLARKGRWLADVWPAKLR